jgi:hypothetical protein
MLRLFFVEVEMMIPTVVAERDIRMARATQKNTPCLVGHREEDLFEKHASFNTRYPRL